MLERTTQPQTLIEKLEAKLREFEADYIKMTASASKANVAGNMNGLRTALNIIKSHSDWVSVDEQLPPHNNNDANTPKILGDSETYGVISVTYDVPRNLWFAYGGDDQIFDITSWMFTPNPPSEVQGD